MNLRYLLPANYTYFLE